MNLNGSDPLAAASIIILIGALLFCGALAWAIFSYLSYAIRWLAGRYVELVKEQRYTNEEYRRDLLEREYSEWFLHNFDFAVDPQPNDFKRK